MSKKEIKLEEKTSNISFDVTAADIKVCAEDIKTPYVEYEGDIEVNNKHNSVLITEKNENKGIYKNNNSTIIIGGNSCVINNGFIGGGRVIINGVDYSNINNNNSASYEPSKVTVYYPAKFNDMNLNINAVSSDVEITDLMLLRTFIKTVSGDITLEDINSIYTYIKTVSGDIKASLLESIINYNVSMDTVSGDTSMKTEEKATPVLLDNKNIFESNTVSGDIKVLFKGKRQ